MQANQIRAVTENIKKTRTQDLGFYFHQPILATVEEANYLLIQMLDNWFNDQGRCCSGPDGLVPELAN